MNPINNRRAFLRNCAVLGAVGAAGILLPGCEKKDSGAGKSAAVIKGRADQIVDFKYPDNPSFDLVYVADSLGYFEGTRARPKYIGRIAAPQVIPLTGTGEIDFGARMVPLVISAIASGLDLKVVAAGGKTLQEAPHMKYFVRDDSGIVKPKDLCNSCFVLIRVSGDRPAALDPAAMPAGEGAGRRAARQSLR